MNKAEIKALRKKLKSNPFGIMISIDDGRNPKNSRKKVIQLFHDDHIKPIGAIKIKKAGVSLWEVEDIRLKGEFRGFGKILYYEAMNSVYPSFLCSDFSGCSKDAKRIYNKMDQLSYVESLPIDKNHYSIDIRPSKDCFIINRMYRFKY